MSKCAPHFNYLNTSIYILHMGQSSLDHVISKLSRNSVSEGEFKYRKVVVRSIHRRTFLMQPF